MKKSYERNGIGQEDERDNEDEKFWKKEQESHEYINGEDNKIGNEEKKKDGGKKETTIEKMYRLQNRNL